MCADSGCSGAPPPPLWLWARAGGTIPYPTGGGADGRSMPLGTLQDTGKALPRPFDHRVTHGGHGKTAKAAKEALWAQNGLSAEAPLPPNPLSMHLGHAPRCGTVCPHTLASGATHGAWPQGPKSGSKDGGFSTGIWEIVP